MSTPNPWPAGQYAAVQNEYTNTWNVRGPDGELFAIIGTTRHADDPQMRALAILFSHAPEIFACLDRLSHYARVEAKIGEIMGFECPCCGSRGEDQNEHAPGCDFLAALLAITRIRAITGEVSG